MMDNLQSEAGRQTSSPSRKFMRSTLAALAIGTAALTSSTAFAGGHGGHGGWRGGYGHHGYGFRGYHSFRGFYSPSYVYNPYSYGSYCP